MALLFFALGIFTVTFFAVYLSRETKDINSIQSLPENEYRTLSIFFSKNGDMLDCSKTYPVERVLGRISDSNRSALGEFAYLVIADLLKGPTEQEKARGLFTSINEGTRIQRMIIDNGIARVDFNDRLNEEVAGSCRVQAIRSQITETLKQFVEVKEVIISVNGNYEEILQP